MSHRSIIYVDGFNLYYGALKGGRYNWLDIERFFRLVRVDDDIQRIYYFSALVRGPGSGNQRTYLRALGTLPSVTVILGRFKMKRVRCRVSQCEHAGDRIFEVEEEKRSDVNIAIQMLEDA